jgi:hypothetical protein
LLAFLIFFSSFVSSIKINEFVVDPQTNWDGSTSSGNSSNITANDEWVELYNEGVSTINLSGWQLKLVDSTNATQNLSGAIASGSYLVILNPSGTQNNDGQLILFDSLGNLIDSVSYGNWNDGDVSDNADDGNANNETNECLARFPDGEDTDSDIDDFIKTSCTFGSSNTQSNQSNPTLPDNQQSLNVTIAGKIVFKVTPRQLEFGLVQPGSQNNPALNGPITFNVTGSTADVNAEITEVAGFPFEQGLEIDGNPALGFSWFFHCVLTQSGCQFGTQTATPTLNIPADAPAGKNQGAIVYTVFGNP